MAYASLDMERRTGGREPLSRNRKTHLGDCPKLGFQCWSSEDFARQPGL